MPGMAHFCEHMTFLGTEKYPDEDAFSTFLALHSGSSNAYTDSEDTVYYFDVNADAFEGALDRFAQFFIAPVYSESAVLREINAIDSEHAKNINSNSFRGFQLDADSANPLHPLHRFATGTKETLLTAPLARGLRPRQELQRFFQTYYSSSIMTAAVYSNHSFAQLEAWARSALGAVPQRPQRDEYALRYMGIVPPHVAKEAAQCLEIVPVGEMRSLQLSWPIPVANASYRQELLRCQPEALLSDILGHEGRGSLRQVLVDKRWANSVQAYTGSELSDLAVFCLALDLTEEGLHHIEDIVAYIFGYISLLQHHLQHDGLPSYLPQEVSRLAALGWMYAEQGEAVDYVSSLVSNMQRHAVRDYVIGRSLFEHYDPQVTRLYLDQLSPRNVYIKVLSQAFANSTTHVDRHYGTRYTNRSLVQETERWEQVSYRHYPELALPPPNDLIPQGFQLVCPPTPEEDKRALLATPPVLLVSTPRWQVYHKLDAIFHVPKTYAIASLALDERLYDARLVIQARLFLASFVDSINEYLYQARLAGLGFEVDLTPQGVQFIVSGYSDKFVSFAERVLISLRAFQCSGSELDRHKEMLARELESWAVQQPYAHAAYYAGLASESLRHPIPALQHALTQTSLGDVNAFLQHSLQRSYGTMLVAGNIGRADGLRMADIVAKLWPFAALPEDRRARRQAALLPITSLRAHAPGGVAGFVLSHPEPNVNDRNSAVSFSFQLPASQPADYILLELLHDVLEQPFYHALRTRQQLGYIVFSSLVASDHSHALLFAVQSSLLSAERLAARVNAFLHQALEEVVGRLTEEELQEFVGSLVARKLEPDQRLAQHVTVLWGEITAHRSSPAPEVTSTPAMAMAMASRQQGPIFNRARLEAEAASKVSLAQLQAFARGLLGEDGEQRRLLVSQIASQQQGEGARSAGAEEEEEEEGLERALPLRTIEREDAFLRSLPLL
jgi:insulysin